VFYADDDDEEMEATELQFEKLEEEKCKLIQRFELKLSI